jgi:hypothetical protein
MTTDAMSTVKVPRSLRERISREAANEGLTAAGLLTRLLDDHARRGRFASVQQAYRNVDQVYLQETESWNLAVTSEGWDS